MEDEEDNGANNIDNSMILPSFINKKYLEKKFNEEKSEQGEIDNNILHKKIINDNIKLTIYEVDKTNNIEHKIYESDDFRKVIRKYTKINIEKDDFDIILVEILKIGLFIIESKNIVAYGAFFFIKFNDSTREIEILAEEKDRKFKLLTEFSNGNFAYNRYIHRPIFTEDSFYIYDIKQNEKHLLHNYGEYDSICISESDEEDAEYSINSSKYAFFSNGFAFTNYMCFNEDNKHIYLNVVEEFNLQIYTFDFVGLNAYIEKLIYDNNYLYLLKTDDKKLITDNRVYIFDIKKKKFYPNSIKISYKNEKGIKNILYKKIKNKEISEINIIYHDENLKFDGMEIILDSHFIQKETKMSLILSNDLENLDLLLKKLRKDKIACKFILIVNGSSAEKTFYFIKNQNYKSLFINGIIYTSNIEKYEEIKYKHPDFFKIICVQVKEIVKFIKDNFGQMKDNNKNYYINSIINNFTYKDVYYPLHKELSKYYGDENEKSYALKYKIFSGFLKNEKAIKNDIKENLLLSCQMYKELIKKNYEKIIICYLKDKNFSETINLLLMKKDISIYKKIGYFIGNLMHSLVEFGKNTKRGVNSNLIFYRGMQLTIIDLLEFLKNRGLKIAFPNFVSLVDNKDLAEIVSERKMPDEERRIKQLYSVIMKINYLYDDGYEPSVFNIKDLSQNPDEEEFILLPFTFLKLKTIAINSSKYIADFELDIIGKKEILEYKIKESKIIEFDNKESIMFAK